MSTKGNTLADGALTCSYNIIHVPVKNCSFHLLLLAQKCNNKKKKRDTDIKNKQRKNTGKKQVLK